MGLLNIICSPYLFFSQQAFNLTPCTRFVLLLAPRFSFLKASVFVFVPEDDPLRLCLDACTGGAAAGTPRSLLPCTFVPQPGAPCSPSPGRGSAEGLQAQALLLSLPGRWRAGTGQQGGSASSSRSVPEGFRAGILSALPEQCIRVG